MSLNHRNIHIYIYTTESIYFGIEQLPLVENTRYVLSSVMVSYNTPVIVARPAGIAILSWQLPIMRFTQAMVNAITI